MELKSDFSCLGLWLELGNHCYTTYKYVLDVIT